MEHMSTDGTHKREKNYLKNQHNGHLVWGQNVI